ncbi:MAG TPA: T9SS type A sorting domain-containing protein [Bacteroidetes bacterium]|nr:T9SS type A sorting domain-containing protein [Bacteroidota bacterium]
MKTTSIIFVLLFLLNHCLAQGIFAADIHVNVSNGADGIYVTTFVSTFTQEEAQPFILIDYGDGTEDVLFGQNFELYTGYYQNEYYMGHHFYQDTGMYTITYIDSSWIDGVTNMEDSGNQPFKMTADVLISNESGFTTNQSVFFSSTADFILYEDNGIISHPVIPVDFQVDTIVQRFVDIDVPGYYLPEATDTLACCLVWDRPTEPGRYVFGFDFEDWRYGRMMSRVQRYITVEVDSVIITDSKEQTLDDNSFSVFPNPADTDLRIFFRGAYILGAQHSISIADALGRCLFQKTIGLIEYGSGITIDVGSWLSGLYIISFKVDGHIWSEKIIVY